MKQIFENAGISVNGSNDCNLQVHDARLWNRIRLRGSLGLGEAYMDGWWDCDAIDELSYLLLRHQTNRFPLPDIFQFALELSARIVNYQKWSRAFQVGKAHYDIGNELFGHMLDKSMNYSCGYWRAGAGNLEDAQVHKMDLICRKLNLREGMRLLDIGCGWGSLCKYAAENYGVETVGLTVSRNQIEYAEEQCQGLPATFLYKDYRDITDTFDRIASVGMFEHVGSKNYKAFFDCARRCLKPEGRFLLHTIGSNETYYGATSWHSKYIFPNGHLPSISQIGHAIENRFIMEDVHNFGPDYDKTLLSWYQRFHENWEAIQSSYSEKYDERFYRMWRYYLLTCAGAFRARHLQLWQWVLSPNGLPSNQCDGVRAS